MKVKEVLTNKDCIVTNDGYILTRLNAVENFDELRLELQNEELEAVEQLYDNVVVVKGYSSTYISPDDVGVILTNDISKEANSKGVKINSRPAKDDSSVALIDLSPTSDVAATISQGDIEDVDTLAGMYYFICSV